MTKKKTTRKNAASLESLTPDAKNVNKGNERGAYMIARSLEKLGAGRSIVVDKHNKVIAGNKTLEAAVDMGLKAAFVDTDGTQLVVVRRTDLDLEDDAGAARELAIADNRTAEISYTPDFEQLLSFAETGVLDDYYFDDELLPPAFDESDSFNTDDLLDKGVDTLLFHFGEYRARVSPRVYDKFVQRIQAAKGATLDTKLENIL